MRAGRNDPPQPTTTVDIQQYQYCECIHIILLKKREYNSFPVLQFFVDTFERYNVPTFSLNVEKVISVTVKGRKVIENTMRDQIQETLKRSKAEYTEIRIREQNPS
jgi:hypothetical protein